MGNVGNLGIRFHRAFLRSRTSPNRIGAREDLLSGKCD